MAGRPGRWLAGSVPFGDRSPSRPGDLSFYGDEVIEPATDGAADQEAPRLALRPVPEPDGIPSKRCPDQHPNDPEATVCRLCARPLDVAASIVDLPPEPLARLLLEDGTAIDLVENLLIGRCPPAEGHDADVLAVAGRQVSRLHLLIEVRGWRLGIRDQGSTNGTFVTRRGERGRRRVPEDRPIPLGVGETVHFGDRQALVVGPTG